MVDVRTETKHHAESKPIRPNKNGDTKPVNPRDAIREARRRRLRVISDGKAATIKVFAANEDLREVLRHPGGSRFRSEIGQGVEWPNDSFTKRRIADGSVGIDGPGSGEPIATDESLNPRQQSAARYGKEKIKEAAGDRPSKPGAGSPRPEHPIVMPLRLSSLSPNTAVAGSVADIVMSCIGQGFTEETVIKFGDYDEPTTFVSTTEVTTGVKPSIFVNPDTVQVLVHTGDVASESLTFTFTAEPAGQPKAAKPAAR